MTPLVCPNECKTGEPAPFDIAPMYLVGGRWVCEACGFWVTIPESETQFDAEADAEALRKYRAGEIG
jgi:hypothetical protein